MKRKLFSVTLKDCRIETFTVGGPGGGGKDTSQTGRRIVHLSSGAVGRAVDTRSGQKNTRLAFERMANTAKFKTWVKLEAARLTGNAITEEKLDEMMQPHNLNVEVKNEKNQWVKEKSHYE